MIQILFVDDDPLILAGLKRLFRRFGDEWQMDFVTSGEDALSRLGQRHFDVIVSDMRMPGMDGAELLRKVRDSYPSMIRVILSGQSSQEAAFRTLGPAHQYLTKPCDPAVLRDTLSRALELQRRLNDPKIQSLVTRIASLPSLPRVFHDVVEELNSSKASVDRVGQIISSDVGMTAKLMQLVNSSYFGLSQRVTSPTHAAALLGLNLLKSLVLSVGVFSQFREEAATGFSLEQMVQHSTEVGQLAKAIARGIVGDEQLSDDALLAGLLHDIGKLALATSQQIPYDEVLRLAHEKDLSLWHAERALLGVSHAEVGGYLLSLWGLPQAVVEAVALHHEPSASPSARFTPLTAVHAANGILYERAPQWLSGAGGKYFDDAYLEKLGLQHTVSQWIADDSLLAVGVRG